VDAAYKTIAKMTKTKSHLVKFSVNAITTGTESQGEVTVRLGRAGRIVNGVARSRHRRRVVAASYSGCT
jgi:2-isopropylmalate synthase